MDSLRDKRHLESLWQAWRGTVADRFVSACRSCATPLRQSVVDLGLQPLANDYPGPADIGRPDAVYPLHPFICEQCWLMQIDHVVKPDEIFSDYAYFSSYSDSWLEHARLYAERMVTELDLGPESSVVEVASNDGYLLRNFVERGIPVRGIEPARNVAAVAIEQGVPTEVVFLGRATAEHLRLEGLQADLLIGNNVLAHVPDVNDFVAGLATLLAPSGTLTMEFPHVLRLIEESQFDTIYHEHFSYLSLMAAQTVFARHGLDDHRRRGNPDPRRFAPCVCPARRGPRDRRSVRSRSQPTRARARARRSRHLPEPGRSRRTREE